MLAHWARRWTAVAVVVGVGCLAITGVSGQGNGKKQGEFGTITTFATIAFDTRSKSLLVANHALLTEDPAHFAVLRIDVGDPGDPLDMP